MKLFIPKYQPINAAQVPQVSIKQKPFAYDSKPQKVGRTRLFKVCIAVGIFTLLSIAAVEYCQMCLEYEEQDIPTMRKAPYFGQQPCVTQPQEEEPTYRIQIPDLKDETKPSHDKVIMPSTSDEQIRHDHSSQVEHLPPHQFRPAMRIVRRWWPANSLPRFQPHTHLNPDVSPYEHKHEHSRISNKFRSVAKRLMRKGPHAIRLGNGSRLIPFNSRLARSSLTRDMDGHWVYTGFGTIIDSPSTKLAGTYTGQISQNRKHGVGRQVIHESQSLYVGAFKNNVRDGHGRLYRVIPNDQREVLFFVGVFQNNHAVYGYAHEENGDKYLGHWNLGYYDGEGKLTRANGVVEEGIFARGVLVERKKIGE